jgi:hypothetical protein
MVLSARSPSSAPGALSSGDYMGAPILAGAGCLGRVQDALMSEAVACLKALEAADLHGISRIILETDASQMDEAIRTTIRDLAPSGNLLEIFGNSCMNVLFVSILYMYPVYVTRLRTSLLRLVGAGYRANHMYGRTRSQSVHGMVSSRFS